VADSIKLAVLMTPAERRSAMEKLRTNIRDQDVYWWLAQFLKVCGTRLNDGMLQQPAGAVA
jgi:trehalose-6-phosphate synthase